MSKHLDNKLENSHRKNTYTDWFKIMLLQLNTNTELARAVDVMQRKFTFDFDD